MAEKINKFIVFKKTLINSKISKGVLYWIHFFAHVQFKEVRPLFLKTGKYKDTVFIRAYFPLIFRQMIR